MTVYGRNHAPRRIAVYRLFDDAGRLLYVGITEDPNARWGRHAGSKPWWGEVARKDVTWIEAPWAGALRIEAEIIRSEQPAFNGTHNYPRVPFVPAEWPAIEVHHGKAEALADRIRNEIRSGHWEAGARIPTRGQIASASGVSKSTAAIAYRELQDQGLIWCMNGLGSFVSDGAPIKRPNRQHLSA